MILAEPFNQDLQIILKLIFQLYRLIVGAGNELLIFLPVHLLSVVVSTFPPAVCSVGGLI